MPPLLGAGAAGRQHRAWVLPPACRRERRIPLASLAESAFDNPLVRGVFCVQQPLVMAFEQLWLLLMLAQGTLKAVGEGNCSLAPQHITFLARPPHSRAQGESTGAGVIFGNTGGVMEAALRTAYELATG